MIIQISVAVIAVAFVALVLFLIKTLRSITDLISKTNDSIRQLQLQVNEMRQETTALIRHADEVTVDVRNKLHSMDPLFYSVKMVGDVVSEITHSVKKVSDSVNRSVERRNYPRRYVEERSWLGTMLPAVVSLFTRAKAK